MRGFLRPRTRLALLKRGDDEARAAGHLRLAETRRSRLQLPSVA
jgi:hypothetical protein